MADTRRSLTVGESSPPPPRRASHAATRRRAARTGAAGSRHPTDARADSAARRQGARREL